MRIAIGGFQHETNTFAPTMADYRAFEQADSWPALQHGPSLVGAFNAGMNIPIAGFIAEASKAGHTFVPLAWCHATPSAHVTEDAFERITGMIVEGLRNKSAYDAVYLDLHGAMVCEHVDDGEGEILERVRRAIGSDVTLVASLDLHANVTERMVMNADALIVYRTYPHIDMGTTGARAAAHMEAIFKGMPKQAKAFRRVDYLIPLTAQCTMSEPAAGLYREVAALDGNVLGNGRVSSVSLSTGFPPADFVGCGASVVAYADTEAAANEAADKIAKRLADSEALFREKLWSPRDAVAYAMQKNSTGGPVVLADTQDNPGAGGNGDTVGVLRELLSQKATRAALGVLFDPQSAAEAAAAGEGARVRLKLGAKTGGADEEPVDAEFEVVKITDGDFLATGPFYGGSYMSLGTTARLRSGGVEIVVASRKAQCADQEMLRHTGIEPSKLAILVVKSSVHFRADFQPISSEVLIVESSGPNIADLTKLPYKHLRQGIRVMPQGKPFGS
ncbi:MAG: M81 family metallopeptidase [Parvibaculum sp.]|nr:M81 family metallopeptidase [Parvibaculum sp.]